MSEIKVCVLCAVYNHEKYIRNCLEGILSQRTDFAFEVLVHDDASTDSSALVIREFEKKYPDIIKPIYQTENQYSKGISITLRYQLPRARGKYISFCEGDDYWIDKYKLQKQFDYMESHPDCTFCFTNGYIKDMADGGKMRDFIPYNDEDAAVYKDESCIYTLDDMHRLTFVPTASYFLPAATMRGLILQLCKTCPTGDLRLRLYATACGYAYYLRDKTCVYRQNVPNSAMTGWKSYTRRQRYSHNEKIIEMIAELDGIFSGKYKAAVERLSYRYIRSLLFCASSFSVFKDDRYRRVYNSLPLSQKVKCVIKILTPDFVIEWIRKIKKEVK